MTSATPMEAAPGASLRSRRIEIGRRGCWAVGTGRVDCGAVRAVRKVWSPGDQGVARGLHVAGLFVDGNARSPLTQSQSGRMAMARGAAAARCWRARSAGW